jgi:hypothetical protein
LRLREKDKQARKALENPPSGKTAPEKRMSMTSMTSMTSTPPAATSAYSFSPINTPPPTGPSPDYGRNSNPPHPSQASRYNGPSQNPPHPSQASRYNDPSQNPPHRSHASPYNGPSQNPPQHSHVSPYSLPPTVPTNASSRPSYSEATNAARVTANSTYKPPPINASVRVQNPYMHHDPNTLSHALERPRPSGFGVLRMEDLKSTTASTSNKRRRGSDDVGRPVPPRTSAGPTPYISRVLSGQNQPSSQGQAQVAIGGRAEDATKRAQTASSATADAGTPMTDAPPAPKSTNTLATAIEISSSGSESDIPAAPKAKPIPTPEKAKKNESPAPENGKESTTESESNAEEPKRSSAGPRRGGFMAKRGGKN